MAGRSDVKAFNFNQGDSAAVLGPNRSRIRQVVIFGNAAGVSSLVPCTTSQRYSFLSCPPDASIVPAGCHATAYTLLLCEKE